MDKKQIWVYAENSNGKAAEVFYELVTKAKKLANEMGDTSVAAVVLGKAVDDIVAQVKISGVDTVYVIDNEKLADYSCQNYSVAMKHLIQKYDPYMVLVGATAIGAELAPTVAAKVKTGLAAHCVDIKLGEDRVNCMIPAFGGKVVSQIYIPEARPIMASVRPGILEAIKQEALEDVKIIEEDGTFLKEVPVIEELVEFVPIEPSGKDIAGADVVVVAGRGVNATAWEHLQQFAEKIQAPIGWTRSFMDAGFVPDESQMIGTSGKSIKSKLVIGFGISGATHFTCGINKAKTVININNNGDAPIFDASDYGIVEDADKILKGLLEKYN